MDDTTFSAVFPVLTAPAPAAGRLAISSNRHTTLLDVNDVTYIETDGSGRGCVLHTLSGDAYTDSTSMSDYESRLADQGFYRTHKTCLVQLKYIQDIFPQNNSGFTLRVRGSSTVLPISRDRVKELRRRLNI